MTHTTPSPCLRRSSCSSSSSCSLPPRRRPPPPRKPRPKTRAPSQTTPTKPERQHRRGNPPRPSRPGRMSAAATFELWCGPRNGGGGADGGSSVDTVLVQVRGRYFLEAWFRPGRVYSLDGHREKLGKGLMSVGKSLLGVNISVQTTYKSSSYRTRQQYTKLLLLLMLPAHDDDKHCCVYGYNHMISYSVLRTTILRQ